MIDEGEDEDPRNIKIPEAEGHEVGGDVGIKFPHPKMNVMSFYALNMPSRKSISL